MAVTRTSLQTDHPEWSNAPDDVVDAAIARAQAELEEDVLGADLFDPAVTLRACQVLARHPQGRDMRLKPNSRETIYDAELDDLLRARGTAYRVTPR